jgi:hypothetical protein
MTPQELSELGFREHTDPFFGKCWVTTDTYKPFRYAAHATYFYDVEPGEEVKDYPRFFFLNKDSYNGSEDLPRLFDAKTKFQLKLQNNSPQNYSKVVRWLFALRLLSELEYE